MKALVKTHKAPGLTLEEVPIPEIGDNDALIKVRKNSICGTDVHIWKWDAWAAKTIPVPLIIGHEFMGEIAALGKNVQDLQIGQRVSGEGHLTCGHCPNCLKGLKHLCVNTFGIGVKRPGAFAEYLRLPAENVFPLSESLTDDIAAIADPFGNAIHTAMAYNLAGEDVLIAGAGPIGCMAAAIAKHAGARHVVVTDINDYRLGLALKLGATSTINVAHESLKIRTEALGIKYGYTVGLEMSGSAEGLNSMLEVMQNGGNVALLGIQPPGTAIDWDLVIFKMLTLKGIYGREVFATWFKIEQLIESGLNIDPIITHHFPIADYKKAFDLSITGNSGKIILSWP